MVKTFDPETVTSQLNKTFNAREADKIHRELLRGSKGLKSFGFIAFSYFLEI